MRIERVLQVAAPTGVALIDGERTIDYGALRRRANAVAATLASRGVQPGDRVAIVCDKSAQAVAALFGTWLAGAVAVPLNEALKARQVERAITHCEAGFALTERKRASRLGADALARATPIELGDDELEHAPELRLDDARAPAAILYTSGSTGLPKGIVLSHDNLVSGTRIVTEYLQIAEDEKILSVLPFGFDYGLNQLLTSVARGATLVLARSHFPPDLVRLLIDHEITALAGVPPLFIQLADERLSPFFRQPLPHLRYLTNSGGVFPVELVQRYQAHLPQTRIYLMYGLSEAFRSTYLPPSELEARPWSMGRAIPETEILVVRDDGSLCDAGEPGELVHAGPTVSLGYHRDPEASARVIRPDPRGPREDGAERPPVVYSGDLVVADDEGYLRFVARRDQQMKSRGYRISPEEVEAALLETGMVAEAGVHGRPDAIAGQVVIAHVVPAPGSAGDAFVKQLATRCTRDLPSYMVPAAFVVHASLPRTSSGKLDRKALAAADAERAS